MFRAVGALVGAVACTFACVAATGVAAAQPAPPCSFTLSPPELLDVAGETVVAATVTPSPCGFPAAPYNSVACVAVQGGSPQCTQARGNAVAQIHLRPYQPGTTYVSSGRGCGSWAGNLPAPDCQVLGPTLATL